MKSRRRHAKDQQTTLHRTIAKCERYKQEIAATIAKIRAAYAGAGAAEAEQRVQEYLGDRTYEDWILLYDGLIKEAQVKLEQLKLKQRRGGERLKAPWNTLFAFVGVGILLFAFLFAGSGSVTSIITGSVLAPFADEDLSEWHNAAVSGKEYRLVEHRNLFGSRYELVERGGEKLTGLRKDGKEGLEIIVKEKSITSSYGTPIEQITAYASPISYSATYRVFNNKPLPLSYVLVPPGTQVSVQDADGNPVSVSPITETTDFQKDWDNANGILADIRSKLAEAGTATRLDRIFPEEILPSPGERMVLMAYNHPPGSWAQVSISSTPTGRILFLDPAGSWWDEAWKWKNEILIEEQGAGTLTNYSVKIKLNSTNFDFSDALSNGSDIRVTLNSTGTETLTPHWIESWDAGAETAVVWFLVPQLNQSTNTTAFLYYGNSQASDAGEPQNVFDVFILMNATGVASYSNQDVYPGSYNLRDHTIMQWNNSWKYVLNTTTVAGDGSQLLEYWYTSPGPQGEIHGVGFETDNSGPDSTWFYKIYGTQNWGTPPVTSTYSGSGDWEHIAEPLDDFSGTFDRFILVLDSDAGSGGPQNVNASIRDLRVRSYATPEPIATLQTQQRGASMNVTLDLPGQGGKRYRGEPFTMNGTLLCERGDCGNFTAWSQFFTSISPISTWEETSHADFTSANSTLNVSISQSGKLLLELNTTPPWWDGDWQFRQPFNITNPAGTLTNYSIILSFNSSALIGAGKMSGDCSDLRVVNNSQTNIPHWIERGCNTTNTTVWIRVATLMGATNSTFYLYYGNSLAADAADPDQVFDLYVNYTRDGHSTYSPGTNDRTPSNNLIINTTQFRQWGNTWRQTMRDITIAGDGSQVLEYYYNGHGEGELQGVGFDVDDQTTSGTTYRIWGRDSNFGIVGDDSYVGSGWDLIRETLDEFSGTFDRLVWMADDDALEQANHTFRDVRVRQYTPTEPSLSSFGVEEERSYLTNGAYISESYDTGDTSNTFQNIYWDASVPTNTSLKIYTRSSSDNSSWSVWFEETNNSFIDAPSTRYLQYKVGMTTTNVTKTPTLSDIHLEYKYSTQSYTTMNPSSGLSATNPYLCGNLSSNESCRPSWSVTPQQVGSFAVRILGNNTDDGTFEEAAMNHTIDVYAPTYLLGSTVTPSTEAIGNSVTITTQLVNDLSQPLSGRIINFTDTTDSYAIGMNTTDAGGYATIHYVIPAGASLGAHAINISFAGNATEYLEVSSTTKSLTVSSTPNVTNQKASSTTIGVGDAVLLSADVNDSVGVESVWVNVTFPDSTSTIYFMAGAGNDTYTYSFTDTWDVGVYTFKISANNTDGILFDPPGNFTVNATAAMYVNPEKDEYMNFETVQLATRRKEGWWNSSWLYRSQILVQGTNADLSEYQVNLTLDTQTLITEGKLQDACEDLRFASSKNLYHLPITITNDLGVDMENYTVHVSISDSDVLSHLSSNGDDLRLFTSEQGNPYEVTSDVNFWFGGFTETTAELWFIVESLASTESTTYHLYYGDSSADSEENYSAIFNDPIGVVNVTYADSNWNITSFGFNFSTTPVLVGSVSSDNDNAEVSIRVDNVTATNFTVRPEESATLDGTHAREQISYIALIPGTWSLGGQTIRANTTAVSNPTGGTYQTIDYGNTFDSTPQALSTIMTVNEADPAHTRQQNLVTTSFDVKLEETNGDTAHASETVGWVAIPGGTYGTGENYLSVGSVSTTHLPATVNYGETLTQPVVVAKISSENGGDNSHERLTTTTTSTDIWVEEEDVHDGSHTTELISYLVAEAGIIYGASLQPDPGISIGSEEVHETVDTELDYFLVNGCNTTDTELVVQVAFIPADENETIYYYYGNPSATNGSSLNATMSYSAPQTIGYVVSNTIASNSLTIYSYEDNNSVSVGSTSTTLAKRGSQSFSVSIGDAVQAMLPIQAESATDGTDIISPSTWAGTTFIYNWRRGTDDFHFLSPWGTANVTIYDNGALIDNFNVGPSGLYVDNTYDIANGDVMYIVSDIPILVQHSAAANDATPLYPATAEPIYGIPSGNVRHAAGPNGSTVTLNQSSGGTLAVQVLGAYGVSSTGATGGDGGSTALRAAANGSYWPIGSMQQADGDGGETTIFLPERQLGTIFGSSQAADHIAVAAPTLGTNCTVYDSAGTPVGSSLSAGNSLISRIGFGTGNDNQYVGANWMMYCDNPVFVIFDADSTSDEQHILSWQDMRQYHYPEPVAAPVEGTEEQGISGLHNLGFTNVTGYLYLAVQSNSTGSWQTITPPVYQDITPRTIEPTEVLNISDIWATSGAWTTGTQDPGWYRVYAALRDNESTVLEDSRGLPILDTGLFQIILSVLTMNTLTHENDYTYSLDEYEAGDTIDWINVTIQANNNTAISATINLTLINGSGLYPGWGPDSEQSCGNIAVGDNCTRQWDNSGSGYGIPSTVPSNTYTFTWQVNATADNANTLTDNSFIVDIHNIPSTFVATLAPSRIFTTGNPATYSFNFTNLWSQAITVVNATINCPAGANLNCTCGGTVSNICTFPSVGSLVNQSMNFTIQANDSSIPGDYYLNVTLNYTNPGESRSWPEQVPLLIEVRLQGILAITVEGYDTIITRGQISTINASINNTAASQATNIIFNYTLPSIGWNNLTPTDLYNGTLNPSALFWNNLTYETTIGAHLGPQQVRLDSASDQGQQDFKILTITVYADTNIPQLTANDTNASRGETILLVANLTYENGTKIIGQPVEFIDETDSISYGTAVTNSYGQASQEVLIPGAATLGVHIFNATYTGSETIYTNPSWDTINVEIGLKPAINSLTAAPDTQGPGGNVTITANVTEDDTITSVIAYITMPNTTLIVLPLTSSTGDLFSAIFNQTWLNGSYSYYVIAEDSTGSRTTSSTNTFDILFNAFMNVSTVNPTYGQNEDVQLTGHSIGWWFDNNWLYRRNITFEEAGGVSMKEVTVNFTLNTTKLISESKLQSDCGDIRLIDPATGLDALYMVENCNSDYTRISIRLSTFDAGANASFLLFYGHKSGGQTGTNVSPDSFWAGSAYVVSNELETAILDVAALINNTHLCLNNATDTVECIWLNESETYAWGPGNFTNASSVLGSKTFSSGFRYTGSGDSLTPIGLAGERFAAPAGRGTQDIDFLALYGDANVKLYDGNNRVGETNITAGTTEQIIYNFADNNGYRIESNTTILAHHEDPVSNYDFMPLPPVASELYGILGASSAYDHIACYYNNTNVTAYFDNGTVQNFICNAGETANFGTGGSQGASVSVHIIANVSSVGGQFVADGDGTEGVVWLPYDHLSSSYVIPQAAEYVSVVPITPSTQCDLYNPGGSGLGSATSTAYSPPQPQEVIRFTGSPIPAGSRLVCGAPVYAYYEYNAENGETNLFGSKSYALIPSTQPTVFDSGEQSWGSLLSNIGSTTLSGYLLMVIERNASGGWEQFATVLDETGGPPRQIRPREALDLGALWNAAPWNTGNNPAGEYRVNVSLLDDRGRVLVSSTQPFNPLADTSQFTITPPTIELNITAITIWDVTDTLNKHIYTGALYDNGTNTTFVLEAEKAYRIEVYVKTLNTGDAWNITKSTIEHELLNSSWIIDQEADIWYQNGSDVGERGGGLFSNNVTWNTSGLGGIANPGTETRFSYILNLTGAGTETKRVIFDIDDPLFVLQDLSIFKILVPDSTPPKIILPLAGYYNLTTFDVIRGNSTKVYGRWNEDIKNATLEFNSTGFSKQVVQVSLTTPNYDNWSNHTLVTGPLWKRGNHIAKLRAADLLDNWNTTLPYLQFKVWGLAKMSTGTISNTTPAVGDTITLACRVIDPTASDAPINGYTISFYNGTALLGTNVTNSTGWAHFSWVDNTAGVEQVTCNVTTDALLYYMNDTQNDFSTSITTQEFEPTKWASPTGPSSRVYKGETVELGVYWTDNFQLDDATLVTNSSGDFQNITSLPLSGVAMWANFSYQIPTTFSPGDLGWYQWANDTSGNVNASSLETLDVWGWAMLADMTLKPPTIFTDNTTNISCKLIDANQTNPLVNYTVRFYNSTDLIAINKTNATGWAHAKYTDKTTGQENIFCRISYNETRRYNTSLDELWLTLNTVAGGDTRAPILNGPYSLNGTTVQKGNDLLLYALWNESINQSTAQLNTTSKTIKIHNVSPPYTDFWTNYTIETNASWLVGNHVARLTATDFNGNINNTLGYLEFEVTATSRVTWLSPTGQQDPGLLNLTCLVEEVQNGQPIPGYQVYFYNDTGELIGTPLTNDSGIAHVEVDATGYNGAYDFSCRIFNAPAKHYFIGTDFLDSESLFFDVIPPHIALSGPPNASVMDSTDVEFNFTVTDNYDSSLVCNLTVDGIVVEENFASSNGVFRELPETVSATYHYWNVTCLDDAGNKNTSQTYEFNVSLADSVPPDLVLFEPENDRLVNSSTVLFRYNATDNENILNCSVYLDGVLNDTDYVVVEGNDNISIPGVVDGEHSWYMMCFDLATNSNVSSSRNFTVDTTPPSTLDLISPANYTITQARSATLVWTQSDDANFDNYTIQLAFSESFSSVEATYYSYSSSISSVNVSFLQDKHYYWRVIAYDRAGNGQVSNSTFQYITDFTGPSIGLLSPGSNAFEPDANVTFSYSVVDYNLSECRLYTNSSGSWATETIDTDAILGFNLVNGTNLQENSTILWNIWCNDSLGNSAFASQNRTLFIGPATDQYDNQTIPINLTVNNSAPSVDSVYFQTLNLLAGTTTPFECLSNVSDNNGYDDIVIVNATFYRQGYLWNSPDDNNNHYTNTSCDCVQINSTSGSCACTFRPWYYADPGNWRCRVAAHDSRNLSGVRELQQQILSLFAITTVEQLIDYGEMNTSDISDAQNVTVINFGNRDLDVSLFGYAVTAGDNLAMTCDGGSIPASYERYSENKSTPFTSMKVLTGNPGARSIADINLSRRQDDAQNSSAPTYWRLEIPPGAQGKCTGTVVFQAELDT